MEAAFSFETSVTIYQTTRSHIPETVMFIVVFRISHNLELISFIRHPNPSSAEVEKGGAIPPLPPYVFMAWCLTN
jgi:hypothetical protein